MLLKIYYIISYLDFSFNDVNDYVMFVNDFTKTLI